jgi:hypothetical protein
VPFPVLQMATEYSTRTFFRKRAVSVTRPSCPSLMESGLLSPCFHWETGGVSLFISRSTAALPENPDY